MFESLNNIMDEVRRAWPFRWQALLIATVTAAIATIVTLVFPDSYTARVQIAVPKLNDLTPTTIHDAEVRFLNDATLDLILRNIDTGMDLSTQAAREHAKNVLRTHIDIAGTDSEQFIISCTDGDPTRARDICATLQAAFEAAVAANNDPKEMQKQVASQEALLEAAERKLQEYRLAHIDVFGQGGVETRLDAARSVLEKAKSDYDAAVRNRDQLQENWRSQSSINAGTEPPPSATGDPLIDRLNAAYTQLETLRARFSENHPDVVTARGEVEAILRQYPPDVRMCTPDDSRSTGFDSGAPAGASNGDYVIDRQEVNVVAANIIVCRLQVSYSSAQSDVDTLTRLSAEQPPLQAQLTELTLQRDALKERIDNLRRRMQDQGSVDNSLLYTIVEKPAVPTAPSSPNRRLWLLVSLLAALAGGAAVAYGRGLLADAFVRPAQLERAFKLPFYGSISQVSGLSTLLGQSAQIISFATALGLLVFTMLALMLADPYVTAARHWLIDAASSIVFPAGQSK